MEVLAGAIAVLLSAIIVLIDISRPAQVPGPVAPKPAPTSTPAAPVTRREPAGHFEPARAQERPPPAQTVLGVFRDTEPDRRTAGLRRTSSALLLAGVTIAVAGGVGGAIYLGLRSLG